MTNLEKRVADLEKSQHRRDAEAISVGVTPHHHIGDKTKEVLAQEWKSLLNELSLDTMTDDESKAWYQRNDELMRQVLEHEDTEWIISQVREFRDILEKIDEVRRLL